MSYIGQWPCNGVNRADNESRSVQIGNSMYVIIRPERRQDKQRIRQINVEAFGSEAESNLIEVLRNSGILLISLIAEVNGEVIGHILFSPVDLRGNKSNVSIAGLSPMAVMPKWQRKGMGSMLVKEGLRLCKESGYAAVVVLGHPEYYARFGFAPSVRYGIKSEYDVPDEVFMAVELSEGSLADCGGIVRYHAAFNQF